MAFSIAIDGPAAAGKTTQAKILASILNFTYIDTGAMFRALAVKVQNNKIEDVPGMLATTKLEVHRGGNGEQFMIVDGEDVTSQLRTPEISMLASTISKLPEVRTYLLDIQRTLAKNSNVVMEGRDIGTVVLPDADVKIYLTADLTVRAVRTFFDALQKSRTTNGLAWHAEELRKRDEQDMNRDVAPLKQADDAILVDNSFMSLETTTAMLLGIIDGRQFCKEEVEKEPDTCLS